MTNTRPSDNWDDWYHQAVEKDSSNCEEKLAKSKRLLKMLWDSYERGPLHVEQLVEDLRLYEDMDVDKSTVEGGLEYLLLDMRDVLPVYDWIRQILEDGTNTRKYFEDLKDFFKLLNAFEHIVFASIATPLHDKYLSEFAEIYERPVSEARDQALKKSFEKFRMA